MNDPTELYHAVREMVKDPSLTTREIAEKTGYKQQYVSQLRRRHKDNAAWKAARERKQREEWQKEQNRIKGLIAEAVAKEREACAKICADIAMHRNLGSYGMMVAHTCANEIKARGR